MMYYEEAYEKERCKSYDILDELKVSYIKLKDTTEERISGTMTCKALGSSPDCVFKSMLYLSNRGHRFILLIPVDRKLNMEKAAAATGRTGRMACNSEVEEATGYPNGLFGPIGCKNIPVFVDISAEMKEQIIVNAGGRGDYIMLSPDDVLKATNGKYADLMGGYSIELFGRNRTLPIGTIIGTYQLIYMRHHGAFGIIYHAKSVNDGKRVYVWEWFPYRAGTHAVRSNDGMRMRLLTYVNDVFPDHHIDPEENEKKQMYQEYLIERAKRVMQENIECSLPIIDYIIQNDTIYIVTEYLKGELLCERMQSNRVIEWNDVKENFLPMLLHLSELNRRGFYLRNIRPDTIILKSGGGASLLGFCAPTDYLGEEGTLRFSSNKLYDPYIVEENGDDLDAFCSVIYYALTGEIPTKPQFATGRLSHRQIMLCTAGVPGQYVEHMVNLSACAIRN